MIDYTCPACTKPLRSPVRDAGRNDLCPFCKSQIVVPAAPAAPRMTARPAAAAPVIPVELPITPVGQRTLSINCPGCGAIRNFRRSSLGTEIRCNACKARIRLPVL